MREVIHYHTENIADFANELNIYPDGRTEAEILDGINEQAKYTWGQIEPARVNEFADRLLKAIGDLKHKAQSGMGASETVMLVNYNGQEKGIGYNDEVPNEELGILAKEFSDICHETVKDVEWKDASPFK